MISVFDISVSEPFDEETINFIAKCAKENCVYECGVDKLIRGRLEYIHREDVNAPKDSTDNYLIEIVAKHLRSDEALYALVIEIALRQCSYLAETQIKSLLVNPQDREDYLSILKIIILENLPKYDHTQGKVVTFMSRPIMAAFRKERNPGSTRYNSGILKNIKKAESLLEADGIANPDAKTIADKINHCLSPYRPISVVQVQNALNNEKQMVEMDENIASVDSPEKEIIKEEENERLRHACDNEHWSVKAVYDVYMSLYLKDASDQDFATKKIPSASEIRKRTREITGKDFSDTEIRNLISAIGEVVVRNGLDRGYAKKRMCPNMQIIDTFIPDTTALDKDIDDILHFDATVDLRLH